MPEATAYKITRAKNAGEKPNSHGGTLVKWYLDLEGPDGKKEDVYCQRKPGNDFSVGQEVFGEVEKGEYGLRLYIKQQDGKTGQTGGGGKFFKPRDPAEIRGIQRSHAQEMAL